MDLRTRVGSLSIVLCALAASGSVRADGGDVDLRTFRPSTDKLGSLATEGIETPGPWNFQLAHWLSLSGASLKVKEATATAGAERAERTVIGPQLLGEPTLNVGIGHRAALGVSMPVVLAQSGDASSLTGGRAVASQGVGDLSVTGKAVAIAPIPGMGGLGLAFVTRFSLPTGDRISWIGDSAMTAEARALAGYDLRVLFLTATAGYRMRFRQHELADLTLGDSIPWGLSLGLRPRALGIDAQGRWTWMLEGHGDIGAVPNKLLANQRLTAMLFGASARFELDKSWSLFGGVETSATSGVGVPRVRGVLGITFAPAIVDDDADGVPDEVDECPGLPEDGKGLHPRDGCPDYSEDITSDTTHPGAIDSDGDGIADDVDKCPNEPGPSDGDGCPKPVKVVVDSDGDGLLDDVDKCPDQPETVNGYQDDDGCPELDRDNDTFLDDVDKCPDEPETFNGFQDDDGCPDTPPAPAKGQPKLGALLAEKLTNPKDPQSAPTVALSRKVTFEGAALSKEGGADVRALAAWLLAHKGYRLRVAVKPEGKGDEAEKLATSRAQSLVGSLVIFAHTGELAEVATWDPKAAPIASNVAVTVVPPATVKPAAKPETKPAPKP